MAEIVIPVAGVDAQGELTGKPKAGVQKMIDSARSAFDGLLNGKADKSELANKADASQVEGKADKAEITRLEGLIASSGGGGVSVVDNNDGTATITLTTKE